VLDSQQGKEIFLLSASSRPALRPSGTGVALSLGVKRPGLEANHSPASSFEVKNGGAIGLIPLPHTSSWHGS
jgi:hypothetical protein